MIDLEDEPPSMDLQMFHARKDLFCGGEGVGAEIGCICCSSSSEIIASHRRTVLPRCIDHRQ